MSYPKSQSTPTAARWATPDPAATASSCCPTSIARNFGGRRADHQQSHGIDRGNPGVGELQSPLRSDALRESRYVADGIEMGWAQRWRANGWQRNTKEQALNPDLWERLLDLLEKHGVVWCGSGATPATR